MSVSVRESQARLLADSRAAEPRARLAQAVSRAEFLLRVSRTLSAVQNPLRALEALTTILVEDLVDVAQVVVRTGAWQLHAGGVSGHETRSGSTRRVDLHPEALEQAMHRGMPEEVVLPGPGDDRVAALRSLLVDETLVDLVDERGTEHLVSVPLAARGQTFGVLLLGRSRGFGFTGTHPFLEDLGERISTGLDVSLVVAESRHVAAVLRASLAPAALPEVPGLELASYYQVAHTSADVGGDFFDVHGPHDDLTLICGDVTGKGVEAAVHAKRIRNAVRTATHVERSPAWILELVNKVLVAEDDGSSERLATATCLRLRLGDDVLRVDLANAGHPPALLLRADGTVEEVNAAGVALALLDGSDYAQVSLELQARDTLLLYTDGITEARGADDLFGEQRLQALIGGLGGTPARSVVESVAVAVSQHLGDRAHDDIAVVAVQFRPDQR